MSSGSLKQNTCRRYMGCWTVSRHMWEASWAALWVHQTSGEGGTRRTSSKGDNSGQPFTYQFIIMKISIKITNIQIITPMVSTKTRTASVSGRLDLFICNSREKNTHLMIITTGKKEIYLNGNFIAKKQL